MSSEEVVGKVVKEDGETYIASSQRPDGSWRKERKVRRGYTPQDEVPVYESRGRRTTAAHGDTTFPVGLGPAQLAAMAKPKPPKAKPSSAPSTAAAAEKKKKGRGFGIGTNSELRSLETVGKTPGSSAPAMGAEERKALNLRRKLQDIDALQARIDDGSLAQPEKTQLDKIARRPQLQDELDQLLKGIESLGV